MLGQRADVTPCLLARLAGRLPCRRVVIGRAGGVTPVSRSSSSSASCSATTAASRSERLPNTRSLSVCIATRSFSFSASSASTISVRAAVSVGRASGRIAVPQRYMCPSHAPVKSHVSPDDSRLLHRLGLLCLSNSPQKCRLKNPQLIVPPILRARPEDERRIRSPDPALPRTRERVR